VTKRRQCSIKRLWKTYIMAQATWIARIETKASHRSRFKNCSLWYQPSNSYGKAFDTISNSAPVYLAPLWGSIRVLLVVARSYGRFYEKIVDTLNRVGDIIPHCRRYSDDFGYSLKIPSKIRLGEYERFLIAKSIPVWCGCC
jgi:hypothetical protein